MLVDQQCIFYFILTSHSQAHLSVEIKIYIVDKFITNVSDYIYGKVVCIWMNSIFRHI